MNIDASTQYSNDIVNNFKHAKLETYADDLIIYAIINKDDDRMKLLSELKYLVSRADK